MRGDDSDFAALNAMLRGAGECTPRLLIDLDGVERNVARLTALHEPGTIRFVAKSLPSPTLLAHLFEHVGHERLMVFHLPFLLKLVERFPAADILMGKPLPIAAMRRFYATRPDCAFDDAKQLQWLVDTPARLEQVIGLASEIERRISVSIELDVGMHRGGVRDEEGLASVLGMLRANRDSVKLAGFMGYDAHVPKAPFPYQVGKAAAKVCKRYETFVSIARGDFSDLEETPWCINGAGSPTISMHDASSPLNDVSIGSGLVKPSGFDLPTLEGFEAAAWIATPVIKRLDGVRIPFIGKLASRGRDALFVYGGKWMAVPVWPDGLRENPAYGLSSNQQMLTVPADSGVAVDDFVFLRPTQSEAVFLQFGDLFVVRDGKPFAEWPTL